MRVDYDAHCEQKTFEGVDYYLHGRRCGCWNCEKTRVGVSWPSLPRKVTVHHWERDLHAYQEFRGDGADEERAVRLAMALLAAQQ